MKTFDKPMTYAELSYTHLPEIGYWLHTQSLSHVELFILRMVGLIDSAVTEAYSTGTQLFVTTANKPHSQDAAYMPIPLPEYTHKLTWMYIKDDNTALYNSWGSTKRYLVYTQKLAPFWFSWRLDFESKNVWRGTIDKGLTLVSYQLTDTEKDSLKPYIPDETINKDEIMRKMKLRFMLPIEIS